MSGEDIELLIQSNTTDGDTTFTDLSYNRYSVSVLGDTQHSTTEAYLGSTSMAFDGTGDYLSVGDRSAFKFLHDGTTDYTVECWVNFSALSGGVNPIIGTAGNSSTIGFSLYYAGSTNNNNEWRALIWKGSGGVAAGRVDISHTPETNRWYHVAAVHKSNTLYFYIDGVLGGSSALVNYQTADSFKELRISSFNVGSNIYSDIRIQDVRISKTAVYSGDFTPPTALSSPPEPKTAVNKLHNKDFSIAFKTGSDEGRLKFKKEAVQGELYFAVDSQVLYVAETTAGLSDATLASYGSINASEITNLIRHYNFEGTLIDEKGNQNLEQTGTVLLYEPGRFNQAIKLNGANQKLRSHLTMPTTSTISLWYKHSDRTSSSRQYIFGDFDGSGVDWSASISLRTKSNENVIQLFHASSSVGNIEDFASTPDVWHHACVTRSGEAQSNGTWKFYLDGSQVSTGLVHKATHPLAFGHWNNEIAGADFFDGWLDNIRIYDKELSEAEVTALYTE